MSDSLPDRITSHAESAARLYHRLIVVAGPPRSGKTAALRELNREHGWPLVNINLALSERLLDLAVRLRSLRAARIVDDIIQETDAEIVLLDNIEMLFQPDLQQDPLRLLQNLSRKRTIVATWRGTYDGTSLTYAAPDHPEFRRFDQPQALILSSGLPSSSGGTAFAQGHLA